MPSREKGPWRPLRFAHYDHQTEWVAGKDRAEQIAVTWLAPVSFPDSSFMPTSSAPFCRSRKLNRPWPDEQNEPIGADAQPGQSLFPYCRAIQALEIRRGTPLGKRDCHQIGAVLRAGLQGGERNQSGPHGVRRMG